MNAKESSPVVRTFRVLELLAVRSRTAAEVAREVGVNRSTSLRLLRELLQAGYVQRDERSKRFRLRGERFYALIATLPDHWDLLEVMTPLLVQVRDETGEAAVFGLPAAGTMIYVAFVPSTHPVAVTEGVGTVRPVHTSALGKAWLSALDEARLQFEIDRLDYEGGTEAAARGPEELALSVEAARQRGFAVDQDETFRGVSCVAVPVRLGPGLIGAIAVSGPSVRLTEQIVEDLGSSLLEARTRLETDTTSASALRQTPVP